MRSAVKLAAIAATVLASLPASGSETNWLRVGEDGWLPAVAATGGVLIQKQRSTIDSSCAMGGPGRAPGTLNTQDPGVAACQGLVADPPMAALRPSASGSQYSVTPSLGFDIELATPALDPIPGAPRLFFRGELTLLFGVNRNVANEGDPVGGVRVSQNQAGVPRPITASPTLSLLGVGSRTTSETQLLEYGAGAGIAFPFHFRGRRIWVKPGAAWTRYKVDVDYVVEAGVKNDPSLFDPNFPSVGDQLRVISLGGSRTKTFDGIGPSLEIEMDVGQFGPIGASVFVNGAAYKVLGDTSVDFTHSASFEATAPTPPTNRGLPADTYTGNWTFEVDPWLYQASVGVRFHWFGF